MNIPVSRRAALKSSAALGLLASFGCSRRAGAPSSAHDLGRLDAVATAQAIKSGAVSPSEVVDAAIERAVAANWAINAIVTAYFDKAREAAAKAPAGAWFGVPTFIKDLAMVRGERTTYGARAFRNFIAGDQSPFMDALMATGVISLGKSASPEFGLTGTTESLLNGAARNPWNLDHSTGGSSGGAAALVAAGVVPVAHGSDGGGSLRVPAASCGVVSLKVSRGRYPLADGPHNRPIDISVQGCESRTVRDNAAFIAMLETESTLPKVGVITGPSAQRRRIGFFTASPGGGAVDREIAGVTEKTAARLAELGHMVEEIPTPFHAGVMQDFIIYWGLIAASLVARWEEFAGRKASYTDFEPFTFGLIEYYETRKSLLPAALERLRDFRAQYEAIFEFRDVILSPTVASPAPKIGVLTPSYGTELLLERLGDFVVFTQFMNIAGAPAISLPAGQTEQRLPLGVQLGAASGQERMLLELAYELEEAQPWPLIAPLRTAR